MTLRKIDILMLGSVIIALITGIIIFKFTKEKRAEKRPPKKVSKLRFLMEN